MCGERRLKMSYIDTIKEKAKADKKTIILPETNDKRTLIAAAHILHEGIADLITVIIDNDVLQRRILCF